MRASKKIAPLARARPVRIVSVCLSMLLFVYFGFWNYTEPTEVGIARNLISGEMWVQEGGGIHFTSPWTFVSTIDIRPLRVAVTSSGHGYNAKLVQFEAKHWREFVTTEGFYYYWWANRISINFGYNEEYRGIKDIMRGYAYATKKYSFITILNEYQGPES